MADTKPAWYDSTKLRKAYYAKWDYSGWVIDLGDETCRYANDPLLGCDSCPEGKDCSHNKAAPRWGDRVPLLKFPQGLFADNSNIIERYSEE